MCMASLLQKTEPLQVKDSGGVVPPATQWKAQIGGLCGALHHVVILTMLGWETSIAEAFCLLMQSGPNSWARTAAGCKRYGRKKQPSVVEYVLAFWQFVFTGPLADCKETGVCKWENFSTNKKSVRQISQVLPLSICCGLGSMEHNLGSGMLRWLDYIYCTLYTTPLQWLSAWPWEFSTRCPMPKFIYCKFSETPSISIQIQKTTSNVDLKRRQTPLIRLADPFPNYRIVPFRCRWFWIEVLAFLMPYAIHPAICTSHWCRSPPCDLPLFGTSSFLDHVQSWLFSRLFTSRGIDIGFVGCCGWFV